MRREDNIEVVPRIHRIEVSLDDRFVCVYLLVGDEYALLVDTGLNDTPRETLVPYLDSVGLEPGRIRYVLTSHADFDHTGGNATMREIAPEVIFVCHELDRTMVDDVERLIEERYGEFREDHGVDESEKSKQFMRASTRHTPVDACLSGGEKVRLGRDWYVEMLHTPGHSRAHLSVYDPRSRSAIIEDAVLWNTLPTKNGEPAFPPTYRYVDTYLASIQMLLGLGLEVLLTGHYPVYRGQEIAEFLAESKSFVKRMDDALRDELKRSDSSSR